MAKSKRIVAALAYLSIVAVSASPCKPHTTTDNTETTSSITYQSTVLGSVTILPSVTETSTLIVSSETELATDSTDTTTTAVGTSTTGFSSTIETTTNAAATTSSAAPEIFCANQIYRGNALSRGYTTTQATSEQECWENCVDDENCNSWFYLTAGACNLYTETLHQFSAPSNEEGLLIGSRNCSPRDYQECNGNIGFGWIDKEPDEHNSNVVLEADCAHICMKNGLCDVWQYDSLSQTCNMFSGSFSDMVTLDSDGTASGRKMLIGARSCSSDFFKPVLGACNGQMAWNNNWPQAYRSFDQYKTVATCARACSIDPMCLSWYVWDGQGDCEFSQLTLWSDPTDIATAGSRNCGVP
ncbi:hypothetical protein FOIG_15391 [Fusarium odoratissimum NRRL 54006]|uniref:Apple domain-containing protein n=2 Tax=Fusarium oxysporum species complex TaxID=171631 RepID=X0IRL6_FUSO5|nr:uncharacterized protein FOIG_15391 [Fusarium odoratissimum NRRL 54006]EXL91492.1 hypothetical protein FOIG_15391 [Fusarium odoratissimum NRRL 54006]TXC02772.1 hypothetical protein FocTR4_00014750 [Fusarium oxysporum f. sp. cubense]